MKRYTARTIDRHIRRILKGQTDIRALYTWSKEGKLSADDFAYMIVKIIEAKAPPKKVEPYVIFKDDPTPCSPAHP